MKIETVAIHNWRSVKDISVDFQDIMIFIGQNNHGKSNILTALLFFFGEIKVTDLDFNKGESELFVDVTFNALDEHDRQQFTKYLTQDNKIKVRKTASLDGAEEYHGYRSLPKEEWLREENATNYASQDSISKVPLKDYAPTTGRITKDIVCEAQRKYIEANKSQIVLNYELETTQFLGVKNVAQGIFGKAFYIPAIKNAEEEFSLKGNTIFNKLYTNVINRLSVNNDTYKEAKGKMKELVEILNKTGADGQENLKRPEEISILEEKLEAELKSWNTTIEIEVTSPEIDEIFKVGTSVWVNDGIRTDVNRKGHGLQRSLIFALIKSWANLLKEQREKDLVEGSAENPGRRKASESSYFLIEEPELCLHPQAQRELYASLKLLSSSDNQIVLTTHSSSFIDMEQYKSIAKVYKNDIEEGTKVLQCTEDIYDEAKEKDKFNLVHWINPDRGELFFAKKIILVEGATDKTIVPYLAEKLGVFKYEYTVIDCASKSNMPLYIKLLNKFKLNYIVVYDKDNQTGKSVDEKQVADKSSTRIEETIDKTFGKSVIFDNDLEEELALSKDSSKNKPFSALKLVSDSSFEIPDNLMKKIVLIYS